MRNLMITAAILAGLGIFMAQMAEKIMPASASPGVVTHTAASAVPVENAGLRSLNISRDTRGHFLTEGRIDGQRIGFMVDTGASLVALNESSAARFGLRPMPAEYNLTVSTAN